eukprot:scaffold6007_cov58-Cyclotella_meneghiniana.AAC.1
MVPSWSNVQFRNCAAPLWLGKGRTKSGSEIVGTCSKAAPRQQYWRAGLDFEVCSSIEKLEIGRSRGLWRGDARLGGAYLAKVS